MRSHTTICTTSMGTKRGRHPTHGSHLLSHLRLLRLSRRGSRFVVLAVVIVIVVVVGVRLAQYLRLDLRPHVLVFLVPVGSRHAMPCHAMPFHSWADNSRGGGTDLFEQLLSNKKTTAVSHERSIRSAACTCTACVLAVEWAEIAQTLPGRGLTRTCTKHTPKRYCAPGVRNARWRERRLCVP